jgi:hypothetical protein
MYQAVQKLSVVMDKPARPRRRLHDHGRFMPHSASKSEATVRDPCAGGDETGGGPSAGRTGQPSAVDRLVEIPGIAHRGAEIILAEVGLDMTRFPTAARPNSVVAEVISGQPRRAAPDLSIELAAVATKSRWR